MHCSCCQCMKAGRVTLPVCECASSSQVVLSDSVSEVQPGGGSL